MTVVRVVEPERKPARPLQLHRSLHAESAHDDLAGYLDGVRDAAGALKRKGYYDAAAVLEELRSAAIARLAEGGAV